MKIVVHVPTTTDESIEEAKTCQLLTPTFSYRSTLLINRSSSHLNLKMCMAKRERQLRSCLTFNKTEADIELKAFQESLRRQRSSHDVGTLEIENKLLPDVLVKSFDLKGNPLMKMPKQKKSVV
jgi:hypothetical protein